MKIVVVFRQKDPFIVEVDSLDSDVSELKQKIFVVSGIKPQNQTVVVKGKILEDNHKLKEFNLREMSKVFIAIKKEEKKPRSIPMSNKKEAAFLKMMGSLSSDKLAECIETLKKTNPEYSYLFNDVDTVEELLMESRNPEGHFEKQRSFDRMMDRNESEPGGFQELVSRYYKIEEILEKNELAAQSELYQQETIIPEKPDAPSTTSLPSPFAIENTISSIFKFFQLFTDKSEKNGKNGLKNLMSVLSLLSMLSEYESDQNSPKPSSISSPFLKKPKPANNGNNNNPFAQPFGPSSLFSPKAKDDTFANPFVDPPKYFDPISDPLSSQDSDSEEMDDPFIHAPKPKPIPFSFLEFFDEEKPQLDLSFDGNPYDPFDENASSHSPTPPTAPASNDIPKPRFLQFRRKPRDRRPMGEDKD